MTTNNPLYRRSSIYKPQSGNIFNIRRKTATAKRVKVRGFDGTPNSANEPKPNYDEQTRRYIKYLKDITKYTTKTLPHNEESLRKIASNINQRNKWLQEEREVPAHYGGAARSHIKELLERRQRQKNIEASNKLREQKKKTSNKEYTIRELQRILAYKYIPNTVKSPKALKESILSMYHSWRENKNIEPMTIKAIAHVENLERNPIAAQKEKLKNQVGGLTFDRYNKLSQANKNQILKLFPQYSFFYNQSSAKKLVNKLNRLQNATAFQKAYNEISNKQWGNIGKYYSTKKPVYNTRYNKISTNKIVANLNARKNQDFRTAYGNLSNKQKQLIGQIYPSTKAVYNAKLRTLSPGFGKVTYSNSIVRKAVSNYLTRQIKPYNAALINAILKHPSIKLTPEQRNGLIREKQSRVRQIAGNIGRGVWAGTRFIGKGIGAAGSGLMKPRIEKLKEIITNPRTRRGERENAIRELYAISKDLRTRMSNKTNSETFLGTLGNLNSILKGQKAPGLVSRIFGSSSNDLNFLPVEYMKNNKGEYIININGKKKAAPPPLGYVLKSYYSKNGKQTTGYFKIKNSKTLQSQLEYVGNGPGPRPTGYYGHRHNNSGYGPRHNNYGYGPSAPSGGIVFAPKINVGAARIGAQTFGGTRVGGQQMGGSHVRTGNTGSTTLKTGNTGGTSVKTGNTGGSRATTGNAGNSRLAVSEPTTNGSRYVGTTAEQLIRGAGGAEAVEKGIQALNAANGNVARAKATSKLPNNTFTNIYAMGGPNSAKRLVEERRRRRTVGGRRVGLRAGPRVGPRVASKKKRVAPKPRKQYIKLTPHQFRRLTEHIKKNNLRKVLIKEITH